MSLSRSLRSMLFMVLAFTVATLAFRFIRNPKSMALIGAALLLAWFGPRIVRLFKKQK